MAHLKVVKIFCFLLEGLWSSFPESIMIIIWYGTVGRQKFILPPHTGIQLLHTYWTHFSFHVDWLGAFLNNQYSGLFLDLSFCSFDVCSIHIILIFVFLIIQLIYFLFFLVIYSLTHTSFCCILLNFQIFWDFFLDVIVLFTLFWSEACSVYFESFDIYRDLFLRPIILLYLGECWMWIWILKFIGSVGQRFYILIHLCFSCSSNY